MVERLLSMEEVTGSIPVFSNIFTFLEKIAWKRGIFLFCLIRSYLLVCFFLFHLFDVWFPLNVILFFKLIFLLVYLFWFCFCLILFVLFYFVLPDFILLGFFVLFLFIVCFCFYLFYFYLFCFVYFVFICFIFIYFVFIYFVLFRTLPWFANYSTLMLKP